MSDERNGPKGKARPKTKSDGRRPERVASRVREALAFILSKDLTDPRLALINIARVEATPDLAMVRVGITVLGDDEAQKKANDAVAILTSIAPSLRARLAPSASSFGSAPSAFALDRLRIDRTLDGRR